MYAPKLPSPACPVLPSGQLTLPGSRVVPALGEMDAVPDVSPPHATNRRHPAVIPQRIRMNRSILIRLCLGRILARPDAVASSPEDHNRGQTRGDPRARLATVLATVALDKTSLSEAQGTRASLYMRGSGGELRTCLAFDNYLRSSAWLTLRGLSATVTILRRKPMPVSTDFMNSAEHFAIG